MQYCDIMESKLSKAKQANVMTQHVQPIFIFNASNFPSLCRFHSLFAFGRRGK
jgi:hypothetical protein